ncbi:hypothetical protein ACTVNX_24085 [Serratia nevei]|uniref:hypothetical protein n=1 Tax=Serratia nevei TaxID=2703794 RepID=UPI003FA7CCEB
MVQRYNPDYVMHAARFAPFARENEHSEFVKFSDYEILKAERDALQKRADALAVENAAMKRERSELSAIGELIRTQDNRITDQPFFAVMTKREIVASEDHDCDRICWVENQSGNYVEATETQHRRLEAIYQAKYEVRDGWDRYAMKEIDVFVTGCFTEQGCKDYINKNGHNLNKPFIYSFGSYRNDEYQTVRKFIMQMPETPATDAALAAIRSDYMAEGAEIVARKAQVIYQERHKSGDFESAGKYLTTIKFANNIAADIREAK